MYREEDYLALSGIQHFSFCRRQWALIHIDQVWKDNLLTVQGELMHERAHDAGLREHRGDVIILRGLTVQSSMLGTWGKCDVVEFHRDNDGTPLTGEDGFWRLLPVEYKHGERKANDADRLQLCAQAMCLEEMLVTSIGHGCLYYGKTHSRERVEFDDHLREKVKSSFAEMHKLFSSRHVPKVKAFAACRSCSLTELCLPSIQQRDVESYIEQTMRGII